MAVNNIIFRTHALQRMFKRGITHEEIYEVLEKGEIIEAYPADLPYPSRLIFGWSGSRPLHVVVAENVLEFETIIITAYEPDSQKWEKDFKRRKKL